MEDNAGNLLCNQPIVVGGLAAYRATTATRHLVRELRRRGIPARLSGSAGTYVCNHLFYGLLHRASRRAYNHRTGFLHLPLFAGQVSKAAAPPACSLEQLTEGVRIALAAALEARTAKRNGRYSPGR
jgi:pyroglutamyl-peptidase